MDEQLRHICVEKGVFLRHEALDLGYDEKTVTRMVRQGRWHRVRHGCYVLTDMWSDLSPVEQHKVASKAVLRTVATPTVLSHTSALIHHGAPIWDLPLEEVHTTRENGHAGRRRAGVRQHQGRLLAEDLTTVDSVPVTSATRAALELCMITDVEHSLVAIDGLLNSGATSLETLNERSARMEFWPHTLATRLVLRHADGRHESPGETRTAFHCWSQGLPRPVPQVEIHDRAGNVIARVDFAWPEHGVFLEFDGKVKYTRLLRKGENVTDVVLREKAREELICRITGWRCVRVTWAELNNPERLAAKIREVLEGPPSYAA